MQFLQGIAMETKKARNLAYFSRYDQSKEAFSKIVRAIQLQIPKIVGLDLKKDLKDGWDNLLEEMKSELSQIENMICVLNDQEPKPKFTKPPKEERPIQPQKHYEKEYLEEDNYEREQREEKKEQPRYPFGREPFKKYNEEDEIDYRNKEKPRESERDPIDWGPRPNMREEKKVPKKSNNTSHQNNVNAKRGDYSKPWQVPAKPQKEAAKDEKPTYLKSVYPDGNGPDAELISMLEREVIDFDLRVSFEDIAELEVAKDLLYEAVIMPLEFPEYFQGNLRKAWKGVLMFGPPGTGKTLLAKAIASIGKTKFFNVTAASFASKWRGESQKLVRILFDMARFYAPTTLFIDEIDAIACGGDNDPNNRKVLTQMLTSMDGANSDPSQDKKVVVIGATNRPWDLDDAIRRRLEKRIYIPLPTEIGRRQLFKICLKSETLAEDVDIESLVKRTDGFSGADINNFCKEAAFMPMRRKGKNNGGWRKVGVEKFKEQLKNVPLTMEDFQEALKSSKPTVGAQQLLKYEKWTEEFGEKGGK